MKGTDYRNEDRKSNANGPSAVWDKQKLAENKQDIYFCPDTDRHIQ